MFESQSHSFISKIKTRKSPMKSPLMVLRDGQQVKIPSADVTEVSLHDLPEEEEIKLKVTMHDGNNSSIHKIIESQEKRLAKNNSENQSPDSSLKATADAYQKFMLNAKSRNTGVGKNETAPTTKAY
jgi:hypothetical protein